MAKIYNINNKKVLFINPPKCGTNSVEEAMNNIVSAKDIADIYGHIPFKDVEETFDISFSTIRNPWERMVSWYSYLKQSDLNSHGEVVWSEKAKTLNFDDFVTKWVSSDISHSTFKPQIDYIKNDNNSIAVDFILSCDNLEKDLNDMLQKIGYNQNIEVKRMNQSVHNDNRDYYDNSNLTEMVKQWDGGILKHYEFEAPDVF